MHGRTRTCHLQIRDLLHSEIELMKRFESVLAGEYRAITEREIVLLEQIITDKSRLLEQLASLEHERTQAVTSAGFGTGPAAMADCLRDAEPDLALPALWHELQKTARNCQDMNRKNQHLVDLCSRHTRNVLHVLRGEEPGQQTYLSDGETDDRHCSRSLAKV